MADLNNVEEIIPIWIFEAVLDDEEATPTDTQERKAVEEMRDSKTQRDTEDETAMQGKIMTVTAETEKPSISGVTIASINRSQFTTAIVSQKNSELAGMKPLIRTRQKLFRKTLYSFWRRLQAFFG